MKHVSKSFNVRNLACYRTYKYLCPIGLFNKTNVKNETLIENIKKICSLFIGYNCFHNYTTGFSYGDRKSYRNIIYFDVEQYENDSEFIIFTIKSHGFLYHQIRKIIGIIIQVLNNELSEKDISRSFQKEKIQIWLAPKHGLYLSHVIVFFPS